MGTVRALIVFLGLSIGVMGQGSAPPPAEMPSFLVEVPKGKPVLIVFVDVGCDHCQRAVKRMNDSASLFARVKMYFVSMADEGALTAFAKRYGPRLKAEWLRDPDGSTMVRFRPVRYPAMFLYSGDKRLLDYEDNVETIFRIERTIRSL